MFATNYTSIAHTAERCYTESWTSSMQRVALNTKAFSILFLFCERTEGMWHPWQHRSQRACMILAAVSMDSCTDTHLSSHHNEKRRQLTFSSLQSVNLNSDCYLRTNAKSTIAFSIQPTNIKAAKTTYKGTPYSRKKQRERRTHAEESRRHKMEIDWESAGIR